MADLMPEVPRKAHEQILNGTWDDGDLERLARANAIIERFSGRHMKIDVGIGIAGIVPGLGKVALLGAIAVQSPIIYQPMVREISRLYRRQQDETIRRMTAGGALAGSTADLAAEFGVEFIKESARELITEHGIGLGLAWIPVVGGVVAAGLDAVIARKMTRLVGAMALVYYENSEAWLVSRRNTRAVVRAAFKTSVAANVPEIVRAILREHGVREAPRSVDKGDQIPLVQVDATEGATVIDGATMGLLTGASVDGINPFVLDALERWRGITPHTLSAIEDAFTTKAGVYADAGLLGTVKGYTGEQIASADLHAPLPPDTMVPGWDLPYDGQLWQIKVGSTAYDRAATAVENHPEYPIISDPETASRLEMQGQQTIGLSDLDNDHLTQITEQTAVSINDLSHIEPGLPIASALLLTYVQLRRYQTGEVSLTEAYANVTVGLGSREAAMLLMTTLAVGISAAAGTLPVAGPFVAGAALTGALGGREIAARLLQMRIPGVVAHRLSMSLKRASKAAAQHLATDVTL